MGIKLLFDCTVETAECFCVLDDLTEVYIDTRLSLFVLADKLIKVLFVS